MAAALWSSDLWVTHRGQIAGVWKCVSYELRDSNGNMLAKPHGDKPLGRAHISLQGYISGLVANPYRMHNRLPSGRPWSQGEDAEVAHIAKGQIMYRGYLELFEDAEELYWQTKVEVANDPSMVGGIEEKRLEFIFDEEKQKTYLVLTPKKEVFMENGQKVQAFWTWEAFILWRVKCSRLPLLFHWARTQMLLFTNVTRRLL
ncbi:hypothetical protein Q7P37_001641 [Cladosporium fusiforme]